MTMPFKKTSDAPKDIARFIIVMRSRFIFRLQTIGRTDPILAK